MIDSFFFSEVNRLYLVMYMSRGWTETRRGERHVPAIAHVGVATETRRVPKEAVRDQQKSQYNQTRD